MTAPADERARLRALAEAVNAPLATTEEREALCHACQPDVVLRLLDDVERAEREREHWRTTANENAQRSQENLSRALAAERVRLRQFASVILRGYRTGWHWDDTVFCAHCGESWMHTERHRVGCVVPMARAALAEPAPEVPK